MTDLDRRHTGAAEAAKILSDVKDRVARLEQERRGGSAPVQLFREVTETITISDSQTVTTQTGAFVFGSDTFNYAEWGDQ